MFKKFFAVLAILLLVSVANAKMIESVAVNFSYGGPATTFRLYMDGQPICENIDLVTRTMICGDIEADPGPRSFTMTAVEGVSESPHSNAFVHNIAADPMEVPVLIDLQLTINGQVINVQ